MKLLIVWTLKIILILTYDPPLNLLTDHLLYIHHERNESSKTAKELRDGCGEPIITISGYTQLYCDNTPDVRYAVPGEI